MSAGNIPTTARVLHPDILNTICTFLPIHTIKSLRLASHATCEVANLHLFRTIVLGLRKKSLKRLAWIASQEIFARSVRTIIWDASRYYDDDGSFDEDIFLRCRLSTRPMLYLDFSPEKRKRERQKRHMLVRYWALEDEERDLINNPNLPCSLTQTFRQLKGLRESKFFAWAYPQSAEGLVYSRSEFEGKNYDPPPLKSLQGYDYFTNQIFAFKTLARTLACHLRDFEAAPSDELTTRPLLEENDWSLPYLMAPFHKLTDFEISGLCKIMRHIWSFSLDLELAQPFDISVSLTGRTNMRRVVSSMASLEYLEIYLPCAHSLTLDGGPPWYNDVAVTPLRDVIGTTPFVHLRTVSLRHFWLETEELCGFLLQHSSTLEVVDWWEMALGVTAQLRQNEDDLGQTEMTERWYEAHIPFSQEWASVAEACHQLPKLRGLWLCNCYDILEGLSLEITETIRLMEVAMDGRPNVYDADLEKLRGKRWWSEDR